MKITYIGQAGFIIEHQGTRLVTDPYLSYAVDHGDDGQWTRLYAPPMTLAEAQPDAVLISHTHDDHFDTLTIQSYLAEGGKAMFVLPKPEVKCSVQKAGTWSFAPS